MFSSRNITPMTTTAFGMDLIVPYNRKEPAISSVVQAEALGLAFALRPLVSPTGQHLRRGTDIYLFTRAHIRALLADMQALATMRAREGLQSKRPNPATPPDFRI
jgi:hypothetical protein